MATRRERIIQQKLKKGEQQNLMQKADEIKSRFNMFDQDKDGLLSFDEFKSGLADLGLRLDDGEAKKIWDQAETGVSSQNAATERLAIETTEPNSRSKKQQQQQQQHVSSIEKRQEQRIQRVVSNTVRENRHRVEQVFKNSTFQQGNVDFKQFKSLMTKSGVPLGDEDCEILWEKMGGDVSTQGGVDIQHIHQVLLANEPQQQGNALPNMQPRDDGAFKLFPFHREQQSTANISAPDDKEKKEMIIRSHLLESLKQNEDKLDIAFGEAMQHGHRVVDFQGFKHGIKEMGITMSPEDVQILWQAAGGLKTGKLDIAQMRADLATPELTSMQHPHHQQPQPQQPSSYNNDSIAISNSEDIEKRQNAKVRRVVNQRVRDHLSTHRKQIKTMFENVSTQGINFAEFRQGLQNAGVMLSENDCKKVWKQALNTTPEDVNNKIRYDDVVKALGSDPTWETRDSLGRIAASEVANNPNPFVLLQQNQSFDDTNAPWAGSAKLESLKKNEKNKRLFVDRSARLLEGKLSEIRQLFASYSAKGIETLNFPQFKAGLKGLGVILSDNDASSLFQRIDVEGAGRLSFSQLSSFSQGPVSRRPGSPLHGFSTDSSRYGSDNNNNDHARNHSNRLSVDSAATKSIVSNNSSVKQVIQKIAASDIGNAHRFKFIFKKFDLDRKGKVSQSEFRQGLTQANVILTHEEMNKLATHADSDGLIDYESITRALVDTVANVQKPPAAIKRESSFSSITSNKSLNTSSFAGGDRELDRSAWMRQNMQSKPAKDDMSDSVSIASRPSTAPPCQLSTSSSKILRLSQAAPLAPAHRR